MPSALQRRRWINNCCNSDRHFTLSLHLCYHLSPESSMSRVEKCQLAYGMNVPKANGTRPLCAQHLALYCPTATQQNVYYIFLVLFIFWLFVCCFYFFLSLLLRLLSLYASFCMTLTLFNYKRHCSRCSRYVLCCASLFCYGYTVHIQPLHASMSFAWLTDNSVVWHGKPRAYILSAV